MIIVLQIPKVEIRSYQIILPLVSVIHTMIPSVSSLQYLHSFSLAMIRSIWDMYYSLFPSIVIRRDSMSSRCSCRFYRNCISDTTFNMWLDIHWLLKNVNIVHRSFIGVGFQADQYLLFSLESKFQHIFLYSL